MYLALFLLTSSYKKERREFSIESRITAIFVLLNTFILNCCSCVKAYNLYFVVPKPRVKLLLTRIRLHLVMQGACAITTALMKRPENILQVVENLLIKLP